MLLNWLREGCEDGVLVHWTLWQHSKVFGCNCFVKQQAVDSCRHSSILVVCKSQYIAQYSTLRLHSYTQSKLQMISGSSYFHWNYFFTWQQANNKIHFHSSIHSKSRRSLLQLIHQPINSPSLFTYYKTFTIVDQIISALHFLFQLQSKADFITSATPYFSVSQNRCRWRWVWQFTTIKQKQQHFRSTTAPQIHK